MTIESTIGQLEALDVLDLLRERVLDYDAAEDRSGDEWDGLRVELDGYIQHLKRYLEQHG